MSNQITTLSINSTQFTWTNLGFSCGQSPIRLLQLTELFIIPDAPTIQHKSHIPKVMFLVAMALPRMLDNGEWFDGKVGLWECVEQVPAKRSSRNRPAGTLEIKPKSMDSDYYRHLCTMPGGIIDKVKEKMPWLRGNVVSIQHDGAKPHSGRDNEAFMQQHGSTEGWIIQFVRQPAQSPDLNILDLGIFHSRKCRVSQLKHRTDKLPDLINKVKQAYAEYDRETLDHIWAHLYDVWRSVLIAEGGNDYPSPHGGGRAQSKAHPSAVNRRIDIEPYNNAILLLND